MKNSTFIYQAQLIMPRTYKSHPIKTAGDIFY